MTGPVSIRVRHDGGVTHVILDRPPLNILDIGMLHELRSALDEVSREDRTKLVVLGAAGRAFCAGADVRDHLVDRVAEMMAAFQDVLDRLLRMEVPVIAVVNGPALGGGCELLLACDVVLASDASKFGQPEIRLGVFPPAAAALLARRVGPTAAADLVLSGRMIEARDAERIGLVTRVFPHASFATEVGEYVASMSALSGPVLRVAKRALQAAKRLPAEAALERAEALYLHDLLALHDAHEGVAAFLEKRAPVWSET